MHAPVDVLRYDLGNMRIVISILALVFAGCPSQNGPKTVTIEGSADVGVSVQVASPLPARGDVTVRAVLSDSSEVERVSFDIDGATVASADRSALGDFTATFDSRTLSDGEHRLSARLTTSALRTFASAEVAFTVDNTAPVAVFSAPAQAAFINPMRAVLLVTASDVTTSIAKVTFKSAGNILCTVTVAPFTCSALGTPAEGAALFEATVEDMAGNKTDISVPVTIDNTPPLGSFSSPLEGSTINPSLRALAVTASDPQGSVAAVRFKRAGQSAVVCEVSTEPYECTDLQGGLTSGALTYEATVIDQAGNETTVQRGLVVDITKPRLLSVVGPSGAALPWLATTRDNFAKFTRVGLRFDEPLDVLSTVTLCKTAPGPRPRPC